jgi:cysteine desulfurase/selenocysteine lyase
MSMDVEKIRKDFPILEKKINGKPIIYFDNACMTIRPKQVIDASNRYYLEFPGCAGRSAHEFATRVTEEYDKSRVELAKFAGAKKKEEIVFTRNTTEGLNLVFNSLELKKGDIIVTTDKEHNSVLVPIQMLKERKGVQHKIIFSRDDQFDLQKFQDEMNNMGKQVKLVAMAHSSNIDGTTIPAKEIIKIAHDFGSLVMLDAAQSVPHKEFKVKDLDVDFLAFSGHKMLGPSGMGVLYGKYELLEKLSTFMVGGDTVQSTTYDSHIFLKPPEKFEAGLQNYAGAIGLAEAARYLDKIGRKNIEKHEEELNEFITKEASEIKGLRILGPQDAKQRGGIFPFVIEGMNVHDVALMLNNNANIMIRSGQHCVHSWFAANKLQGSDRVSLYLYNTKEEAKIFIDELAKIIKLR